MKDPNTSTLRSPASESFAAENPRVPAILFGLTIVLSAFLLFQVQPLIAKLILPWFGGGAAVWTSCMLFFQLALLGGYAWAHWLSERPLKRQIVIHVGLLLVSLAVLPIIPSVRWKPAGGDDPLLGILGLLTATVGLPYFLLSATSPLLQSWYSRANGGAMPYRFFALSNAGSMAGLLTYPVFVEPNLTNRHQAWMWSGGFIAFVVFFGTVAFRSRNARDEAQATETAPDLSPAPTWSDKLLWVALAACASALLLAVTNHLTQNVAAIPFLWVLPLSLYLLSFILCFDSDRWYRRGFFAKLAVVELPAMAYALSDGGNFTNLKIAIAMFSAALFVFFMVCHGELARRRPSSRYLTSFYLMVSVGGATGGLLVGFVFPYVLHALIDLPIILSLTAFLFAWLLWLDYKAREDTNLAKTGILSDGFLDTPIDKFVMGLLTIGAIAYVVVRFAMAKYNGAPALLAADFDAPVLFSLAVIFVLFLLWRTRGDAGDPATERRDRIVVAILIAATAIMAVLFYLKALGTLPPLAILTPIGLLGVFLLWRSRDALDNNVVVCAIAFGLACAMSGYLARETWNTIGNARLLARNFYGALVVYDEQSDGDMGPVRVLRHGTINHGEQFLCREIRPGPRPAQP